MNPIEDWGGLLTIAVQHDRPEILALLLDLGFDPNERMRVQDLEEDCFSAGMPLWHCAAGGKYEMAEMLLRREADPNVHVYASGTPVHSAYSQRDWRMVELLKRHGGKVGADTVGLYRETELARQMLAGDAGEKVVEELLWGAACGGDPEIVRMALERLDWGRDDPRWYRILEQPLRVWNHMSGRWANQSLDRGTYPVCFRLVLDRCEANMRHARFGRTMLHDVAAARSAMTEQEQVAFAKMLLDAGARMDERDDVLKSTPLGWACRWGHVELVRLLIARGADVEEAEAEPWARPRAWAEKMGHAGVLAVLDGQAFRIRRATGADAEAIAAVLEGVVSERTSTAIVKPWSAEEQRRHLLSLTDREAFHVAESGSGEVVGYQSLERYSAILDSMGHVAQLGTFLKPEARGRGVGRALFEASLKFAAAHEFHKFVIQVRASNTGAQTFYKKLGFRECGRLRRQVRIEGMEEDAVILEFLL
ncbi:MAG: GNAT family N-acetyltransferase [Acidobacteriia bacterium]|nr:GNAT family N-acetyltransferase [Terriglobia bacterium]